MKKKTLCTIIVILVSSCASFAAEHWNALKPPQKPVVWQSAKEYSILLNTNPTVQERTAAELLKQEIKKITGTEWLILRKPEKPGSRFVALETDSSLAPEGYSIREKDGDWYFSGGTTRGPINAVLAFLEEDLGWRHYSSFLPPLVPDWRGRSLEAAVRKDAPRFAVREIYLSEAFSPELVWHNRAMPMFDPMGPAMPSAIGKTQYYPRGTWFAHTFARLAPGSEVFKTHPEYFAMKSGVRVQNDICLSHPKTVELVAEKAMKIIAAQPECGFFGISQNDSSNAICQCGKCRALAKREGGNSAPLLHFVNQVAERIGKRFPKVMITTLAYLETVDPPLTLRPASNVIIFLATDTHAWNNPFHLVGETPKFQELLRRWSKTGARIHLWDYTFGDNAHWLNPAPNFDVIAGNLKFYAKFSPLEGILFQDAYNTRCSSRAVQKNWIFTKMLWNPSLSVEELERDFTSGYYGSAAAEMQSYNDLLRKIWQKYHAEHPAKNAPKLTVDESNLVELRKILERALVAADSPQLKKEIRRELPTVLYPRLEAGIRSESDRKAYLQDLAQLRSLCVEFGIAKFSETGSRDQKFFAWECSAKSIRRPPSTPRSIRLPGVIDAMLPQSCGPGNASPVTDEKAAYGCAIRQPCAGPYWAIQFRTAPGRFLSISEPCVVRARIRFGKRKGNGPAFQSGVYLIDAGRYLLPSRVFSSELIPDEEYRDITIGTIPVPRDKMMFFFVPCPDSVLEEYFLDFIELIPESEFKLLQKSGTTEVLP